MLLEEKEGTMYRSASFQESLDRIQDQWDLLRLAYETGEGKRYPEWIREVSRKVGRIFTPFGPDPEACIEIAQELKSLPERIEEKSPWNRCLITGLAESAVSLLAAAERELSEPPRPHEPAPEQRALRNNVHFIRHFLNKVIDCFADRCIDEGLEIPLWVPKVQRELSYFSHSSPLNPERCVYHAGEAWKTLSVIYKPSKKTAPLLRSLCTCLRSMIDQISRVPDDEEMRPDAAILFADVIDGRGTEDKAESG